MLVDENGEVIPPNTRRDYWHRAKYLTIPEGESLTMEMPDHETDVNEIVSRFERTGYLPTSDRIPQYGDVTHLQEDLTVALEKSRSTISALHSFAGEWSDKALDQAPSQVAPPSDAEPRRRRASDNPNPTNQQ